MRDLKIRTRVLIGFSATLLLLLMVSFIGYHGSVQTKAKYDDLINRAMPAAVEVQNMNYNLAVIASSLRGYVAYGDDTYLNTLQKSKEQFHKNIENLLAMTQVEENQRLIKEIIAASGDYEKIVDLSIDAGKNRDITKAKNLSLQGRVYLQTAQEKSTQLKNNIDTVVRDTQKATSEKSAQTNLLTLIFSTIALLTGIILSIIIFRSIVRLTKEIITFIEHVAASSQQISASTEEIAHGSQQQAASASHSSELVREMTNVIQSVAKNTEQASIFSEKAVELSIDGNGVIQEAVT